MARSFNGSSDYLKISTALAAYPSTMACWAWSDAFTAARTLMSCCRDDATNRQFLLTVENSGGYKASAQNYDGTTVGVARSSSAFATGGWHHAAAVFAASNSRAAYYDGGNSGTDATSVPTISVNNTGIGVAFIGSGFNHWDGLIAEAGVWDAALTAAEIASLAAGVCPLFVRPASLVAYWPLWGNYSPEIDRVGGFDLTVTGATKADHPRIIYPSRPKIFLPNTTVTFDPANGFPWLSSPLPQRPLIEVVPY